MQEGGQQADQLKTKQAGGRYGGQGAGQQGEQKGGRQGRDESPSMMPPLYGRSSQTTVLEGAWVCVGGMHGDA